MRSIWGALLARWEHIQSAPGECLWHVWDTVGMFYLCSVFSVRKFRPLGEKYDFFAAVTAAGASAARPSSSRAHICHTEAPVAAEAATKNIQMNEWLHEMLFDKWSSELLKSFVCLSTLRLPRALKSALLRIVWRQLVVAQLRRSCTPLWQRY